MRTIGFAFALMAMVPSIVNAMDDLVIANPGGATFQGTYIQENSPRAEIGAFVAYNPNGYPVTLKSVKLRNTSLPYMIYESCSIVNVGSGTTYFPQYPLPDRTANTGQVVSDTWGNASPVTYDNYQTTNSLVTFKDLENPSAGGLVLQAGKGYELMIVCPLSSRVPGQDVFGMFVTEATYRATSSKFTIPWRTTAYPDGMYGPVDVLCAPDPYLSFPGLQEPLSFALPSRSSIGTGAVIVQDTNPDLRGPYAVQEPTYWYGNDGGLVWTLYYGSDPTLFSFGLSTISQQLPPAGTYQGTLKIKHISSLCTRHIPFSISIPQ